MELSKSKFATLLVAMVTSCAAFADDVDDNGDLTQRQTPYGMEQCTVVDLGIRNLIAMSNSDNIGRNIETLVYNNLNNVFDNIYYYKDLDGEIDLLTHRGNTVTQLIQVVHHGLDCMSTLRREIKPLIAARTKFPQAKLMLVVNEFPLSWHTSQEIANNEIEIIPLWKYLLLNLPK